jgi:hypothetical protein
MCTTHQRRQENLQYWPPVPPICSQPPLQIVSSPLHHHWKDSSWGEGYHQWGWWGQRCWVFNRYPQNQQLAATLQTGRQNCWQTCSTCRTYSPIPPIAYPSHQYCWRGVAGGGRGLGGVEQVICPQPKVLTGSIVFFWQDDVRTSMHNNS